MERLPSSLCAVLAFWLGLAVDASAQWRVGTRIFVTPILTLLADFDSLTFYVRDRDP